MDISPHLIEGLFFALVGLLSKWNWDQGKSIKEIRNQLDGTRLDLAKNYHGKEEIRAVVSGAVSPLVKAIERLEYLVIERGKE